MLGRTVDREFGERLVGRLSGHYRLLGPVADESGRWRLSPVSRWAELAPGRLTRLPAKKVLLPPREPLWSWSGEQFFTLESESLPIALLGLPACELRALDYLDQVFAEDLPYQRRRAGLLRVAAPCTPSDGCFCQGSDPAPGCDLLLADGVAWAASELGEQLLGELAGAAATSDRPPLWMHGGASPGLPAVEALPDDELYWERAAVRCLACGACSAVCPTCYCYAMHDGADGEWRISRERRWDNCFFSRHARVAGGADFRPGRGARLRFRAEHKLLGFAPQQGQASCVGCGRCREACPVDIDIAAIAAAVAAGEVEDG